MRRTKPDRERTEEDFGRLCHLPTVALRPFNKPVRELWERAPAALRARASRPLSNVKRKVWEVLRDPNRLGTVACFHLPFWIPECERGYVFDFFFPEYGVNLQLDAWDPAYLAEELPEIDFDAEPDHPLNDEREEVLSGCGIEVLHLWDDIVRVCGADEVRLEVRRELGLEGPPWVQRDVPGLSPAP